MDKDIDFTIFGQWNIIFSQSILKWNLYKYTAVVKLYIAYNFQQRS